MCFVASVQPVSFFPFCLWLCPVAGCLISLSSASDLCSAYCSEGCHSFFSQISGGWHSIAGSWTLVIRLPPTTLAARTYWYTIYHTTLLIYCPPHPQAIFDRSAAPFFFLLVCARSWSKRPVQEFVAASPFPSLWTRCKLPSGRFYS